jgi:hypothetical protein
MNSQSPNGFQEGKDREMRLKEALVGAHQKFRQNPDMGELNVLFVACGDFTRMSEWHECFAVRRRGIDRFGSGIELSCRRSSDLLSSKGSTASVAHPNFVAWVSGCSGSPGHPALAQYCN